MPTMRRLSLRIGRSRRMLIAGVRAVRSFGVCSWRGASRPLSTERRSQGRASGSARPFVLLHTMRRAFVLAALLAAGCGSSSTSPTPIVPTPAPTLATITGHVTATNGGQPLAGLTAALGTHTAMTDGAGTFSAQTTPASAMTLLLTGAGIVPRSVSVAVSSSRDVSVNAIALGGSFDLNFYRAFVRNGLAQPSNLQPLRRWTHAPNLYIRTVDETGAAVGSSTTEVATIMGETIATWTSGAFGFVSISSGTETRIGQAGWITVQWVAAPSVASTVCGFSDVGQEGGSIVFYHKDQRCMCDGHAVAPRTIRHELGHAMGFYHTDASTDLMYGGGFAVCNAFPSARELAHAAIAYARPVGNLDPDIDPFSAVNLAPMSVR